MTRNDRDQTEKALGNWLFFIKPTAHCLAFNDVFLEIYELLPCRIICGWEEEKEILFLGSCYACLLFSFTWS